MMKTLITTWLMVLLTYTPSVLSITFRLPKLGGCPDLAAQQKFITGIDRFLKTWYVQSSFDTEVLQGKGRCMTATYSFNPITKSFLVATEQFNEDNNNWEKLDADASPANVANDEAKFTVKFTVPIFGEVSGTYTVLGTDYDTYSVIHGCGSILGILHYDCSWLMSVKQKLEPEEEEAFYNNTTKVLEKYETLDPKEFQKVDQVHCDKTK